MNELQFEPRINPGEFKYNARCNILLPTDGSELIHFQGNLYKILAPGTAINDEIQVWNGIYTVVEFDKQGHAHKARGI